MTLFDRTYMVRLKEKFEPITDQLADMETLYDEAYTEDPDTIVHKLIQIKTKKDWENIDAAKTSDARGAIQRMHSFCTESWISVNEDGDPLGVFGIILGPLLKYYKYLPKKMFQDNFDFVDAKGVTEIAMLGFKENNITFVKDVLNKMKELTKQYDFVLWSVDPYIPALNIYEKWVSKNGGIKFHQDRSTALYILSKYLKKE